MARGRLQVGPFEGRVSAAEGEREARRGTAGVATRAPVHDAVREEDRCARGERARADRLHGAVGAQQRHQRVLGEGEGEGEGWG